MILTRVCLAEDEKRGHLVHAVKRKEDLFANDETSSNFRRVHNNVVEANKEDQRQTTFHRKTRDKISRHLTQASGDQDVDLGRLSLDNTGKYVGNHNEERIRIRGILREMQEKLPTFKPSLEPPMSNEPMLTPSSHVPTLGPSASNGPSYGSSSAPSLERSFEPTMSDESSFPSNESLLLPTLEMSDRAESSLAPSFDMLGQNESSLSPSAELSVSGEPSFAPQTSLEPSSDRCTVPNLQCQEFFQSRYPGFFMGGILTCDDPLHVSLPMYFEGCAHYRDMSCPSCLMICADGYPVTNIPFVACCAEACVATCGYSSCNLP